MKELNSQRVISRLEKLIEDGTDLLATVEPRYLYPESKKKNKPDAEYVDEFLHLKFITSSLYFMETMIGKENSFYEKFNAMKEGIIEDAVKKQIALLEALHTELTDVWFWTSQGLANAGVFSNMLEEAQHLLQKGFKIPAAVLAGCVIENHLKNLCGRYGVETSYEKKGGDVVQKKAAVLNQDLCTAEIYHMNDCKEVTNYLGIRNSAAHGNGDEFSDEQVTLMLQGISSFINRNPI